jgi:fructose-bisphosphate aldolase, class I
MSNDDLANIATTLMADGKGILAADETVGTLTKRFDALGIRSTEQSRRTYREMLFTATGAAEFISGVILHDETIRQKSSGGTPLVQVLSSQGIVPGIKVDTGAKPLAAAPGETITEGSTGSGTASRSTTAWARASRSGGPSFASRTRCRARRA